MNEEEALKILGITCLSEHEVYAQAKQQLNELYKNNFTMLSRPLEKGKTKELSKKIEACKLLTEDYQDQAKVFSDLVISAIDDDKLDFLKLLLETVKNDDKFNYLNTEGTGGSMPLNFALGYTGYKRESRVKIIALLLEHGVNPNTRDREGKSPLHCVIIIVMAFFATKLLNHFQIKVLTLMQKIVKVKHCCITYLKIKVTIVLKLRSCFSKEVQIPIYKINAVSLYYIKLILKNVMTL